jgi:hypothetical protein
LDGKTLKSRHLVGTLFFLPREAEAAAIRFEAAAHGDISAGASFGGTPNQAGKDLLREVRGSAVPMKTVLPEGDRLVSVFANLPEQSGASAQRTAT